MDALRGACNYFKLLKAPTWGLPTNNTTSKQLTTNTKIAPDTKNQRLGIVWMVTLWKRNPPFLRQMVIVVESLAASHFHPPNPPQPLKRPSQIPFVTQTGCQARQVVITHKILRIPPTPSNVFWRWPNNRVNEAVQHHMVRTRLRTHSPYHLLYNCNHGNEMFSRTSHTKMSSMLNLNLTSNPNTRLRCKLTDAYQERGASK